MAIKNSGPEFSASPPGSNARFRVTESNKKGSSWLLETSKSAGDVYLMHRDGGRWIKTSFHHSGQWHFSLTETGRSRLPEGQSAYMGVLKDHSEIAPGWLHAMRIIVPRSELRHDLLEKAKNKEMIEIPVHEKHDSVAVEVFLGNPESPPIRLDLAFPVATIMRGDGGLAVAAARPITLGQSVHEAWAPQITEIRKDLKQQGWDGVSATRVVIWGVDNAKGFYHQIEVAIDPA